MSKMIDYKYDVALSFAGEDREYVEKVAIILRGNGVNVFYDKFEEAELWGKDLFTYLNDIYKNRARFTIMFISKAYKEKLWTTHERKSMQERAFRESQEYILPARFDDTEIPGLQETLGSIDLRYKSPSGLVDIVLEKLNWKESERWWGNWNLVTNRSFYDGSLFISSVDENGFYFDLYNQNGAHSGQVEGKANFVSKNEALFETDVSNQDGTCKINFVRNGDLVQVSESLGCSTFRGMHSYFDGGYSLKKDVFFDLAMNDATLSKLFKCVKKEYWDKLLDCFTVIFNDEYDQKERYRVIEGSVQGLATEYKGLLIVSEKNLIWGAFKSGGKVYYFCSNADLPTPEVLREWLSELNGIQVVQI